MHISSWPDSKHGEYNNNRLVTFRPIASACRVVWVLHAFAALGPWHHDDRPICVRLNLFDAVQNYRFRLAYKACTVR